MGDFSGMTAAGWLSLTFIFIALIVLFGWVYFFSVYNSFRIKKLRVWFVALMLFSIRAGVSYFDKNYTVRFELFEFVGTVISDRLVFVTGLLFVAYYFFYFKKTLSKKRK